MAVALILGRHERVWEETVAFRESFGSDFIMVAVKRAGRDWSGAVHHWVSYHPELFDAMLDERRRSGFPDPLNYWGSKLKSGLRPRITSSMPIKYIDGWGGSSGLLGLQVGLMVADKCVLCGIPMTASPRYDTTGNWEEAEVHQKAWVDHLPDIADRTRSMSDGWTSDLLGRPTQEWLSGP